MKQYPIPENLHERFDIIDWHNGIAVLTTAYPNECQELVKVLSNFNLLRSDILTPGGRKSPIAEKLDGQFYKLGWVEKGFDTNITVDGVEHKTPTHKVDCFKNKVGIEVEWNNKDPFFDRDLNNFRLLYDLHVIDLGIIITRSSNLQDIFKELGKGSSYGASTTHIDKLLPKVKGGGAGGCPLVIFGIKKEAYINDE